MTLESLGILNDEQLQAVIAHAGELLKQHDRERKEKALADARAVLAAAGLSMKNIIKVNRGKERKKSRESKTTKRAF